MPRDYLREDRIRETLYGLIELAALIALAVLFLAFIAPGNG